jgi:hypothetical protein
MFFEDNSNFNNLDAFEEIIEKNYGEKLIQDILNHEQIIDDNCKSLVIAPREGFQPLGLFCDKHFEEYNFPTLVL